MSVSNGSRQPLTSWRQILTVCVFTVGAAWSVGLFLHQTVINRFTVAEARMDRIAAATQKADREVLSRINRMETLVLERALQILVRGEIQEQLPVVVEEQLPEVVEEAIEEKGVEP